MVALIGLGICCLRSRSFPAFSRNLEFFGDLVPSPWMVFYILPCQKRFQEFCRDSPCEKIEECAHGRIGLLSLGILLLAYTR
jgi:hypothetical protein